MGMRMKYYYDIPKELFDFTEEDMFFIKHLFDTHISKATYLDGSSFYEKFYIHESKENYSNHSLFKKIAYLFRNTDKHHDYMHVYRNSQIAKIDGPIKPHYDYRSCYLAIPLEGVIDPLHFYDSFNNEIATYEYTGPCILSGWDKHGVPENQGRRCFFHVGGFGIDEQFEDVIKKINDISR